MNQVLTCLYLGRHLPCLTFYVSSRVQSQVLMLSQQALYQLSYLLSPWTPRAFGGKWLCPVHTCILGVEYNAWHAGGSTLLRESKAHPGLRDTWLWVSPCLRIEPVVLGAEMTLLATLFSPALSSSYVSSGLWWPFCDPQHCKHGFEHIFLSFYSYDEEASTRRGAFASPSPHPHSCFENHKLWKGNQY